MNSATSPVSRHAAAAVFLLLFAVGAALTWWFVGEPAGAPVPAAAAAVTPGDPAPGVTADPPTGPQPMVTRTALPSGRSAVGGSIRGRTVRADGTPVAGVQVAAGEGNQTRSDASGRFALEALPGGTYHLTAIADQCASVPSGAVLLRTGETVDGVDLVLERACFVSGHVAVAEGPLAGARVSARLRDAAVFPDFPPGAFADGEASRTVTGADGSFRLGPFPPGRIELRAEHDDCLPFARGYASDATDVSITLPRARCLSGTVLDPDGKQPAALERVLLVVQDGRRPGGVVLNEVVPPAAEAAAGRFRLPLPPMLPGDARVKAIPRAFAPAVSEPLRIARDQTPAPLELRAGRGSHLRGRAHDGAGAPVGAEITVREEGADREAARVTAAADGSFDCVLLAGRHLVSARLTGCTPRQEWVEIRAGEDAALDLELVRGGALTGRVLLAAGAVAAALEVQARPVAQPEAPPMVAPVGDAAFAFDYLAPGDYLVALRERGQRAPGGESVRVQVTDGQTARVELQPAAHGLCRLRGDVQRNGVALPFVTVVLSRGAQLRVATVTADRSGHFEVEALGAGPLDVVVHHGSNGPVLLRRHVELQAGTDHDETLAVAFGAVTGRVLDAAEKIPLNELRVEVVGQDGGVLASGRTGPDGRFQLPVVQSGHWTLAVGRLGEGVAHREPVHVAAGRTVTVPDLLCRGTVTEDQQEAGRAPAVVPPLPGSKSRAQGTPAVRDGAKPKQPR